MRSRIGRIYRDARCNQSGEVAAAQFILIEPDFNAGDPQRVGYALRLLRVSGGVAEADGEIIRDLRLFFKKRAPSLVVSDESFKFGVTPKRIEKEIVGQIIASKQRSGRFAQVAPQMAHGFGWGAVQTLTSVVVANP